MRDAVIARTRRWLDEAVIGLNLCPFAAPVLAAGRIRFAVSEATDLESAVRDALGEAVQLLDTPTDEVSTTLVIVPDALGDFDEFLDAVEALEEVLSEGGADGVLQVATFHPDYRFAGEDADGLSHFTNRAPHPILHLLREDEVAVATEQHPDSAGIPAANIARLEAMGADSLRQMWATLKQ